MKNDTAKTIKGRKITIGSRIQVTGFAFPRLVVAFGNKRATQVVDHTDLNGEDPQWSYIGEVR